MLTSAPQALQGDFGALQPNYVIERGRVLLTRKRWPLALAPLLFVGLTSFAYPFLSHVGRRTGKLFLIMGGVLTVLGGAGAWIGLFPPRRVEVTPGKVRWGREELLSSQLQAARLGLRLVQDRWVVYQHWSLVLETREGRELSIQLCRNPSSEEAPPEVGVILRRVRELLGLGGE
ncbi:hypothetical protein P2318_06530 [Myxococcaceae bacterium GXIMD 01537]